MRSFTSNVGENTQIKFRSGEGTFPAARQSDPARSRTHHAMKTPSILVAAAGALLVASAPAHAVFSMEELQRGLTEQDALSMVKNRHQVAERIKGGDEGYVVLREAGGAVRGMFWTCQGKVHAASSIQEGGIYAFIDRLADMNGKHGRGEVASQIKSTDRGVSRTVETFWKAGGDAVVKLSFTPAGSRVAEAIWLQHSLPSVCGRQ